MNLIYGGAYLVLSGLSFLEHEVVEVEVSVLDTERGPGPRGLASVYKATLYTNISVCGFVSVMWIRFDLLVKIRIRIRIRDPN